MASILKCNNKIVGQINGKSPLSVNGTPVIGGLPQVTYDYGDGSLNTVALGYENTLYCNGKSCGYSSSAYNSNSANFRWRIIPTYPYKKSDIYPHEATIRAYDIYKGKTVTDVSGWADSSYKFLDNKLTLTPTDIAKSVSGTNTRTLTASISGEKTVITRFWYGGLTTGIYIGSVKFCCNGTYYTLSEMVANSICKPLVIMSSCGINGSYYMPNFLNTYNGGTATSGNWPECDIIFMLNNGYTLTAIQWYANRDAGSWPGDFDGLGPIWAFDTSDLRFTINSY